MKKIFFIVLTFGILAACNNSGEKQNAESKDKSETCNWILNQDSTVLSWTAFKTTDKIGVGGHFTKFMIEGVNPAETIEDALKNAHIKIDVSSINTGNPDRDKKITEEFFAKMADTEMITGEVVKIDAEGKSAIIRIKMNGTEQEVPMSMEIASNGKVTMSGSITTDQFMADEALASLNKACYDLHKGTDGISKTWPDVEIKITAQFDKDCQ